MRKLFIAFASCTLATGVMAGVKPFQLSLTPDIAIHPRTERIEGLSLGVWGENPQTALALGVVNGSSGRSAGVSWALVLNYADDYQGVQWAPINYTKGDFLGWQSGFVNYTEGRMMGLQTGVVNYAGHLNGLQLGVVNYAETTEVGLQIGLANIMPQNQAFTGLPNELAPAMVFVNWSF